MQLHWSPLLLPFSLARATKIFRVKINTLEHMVISVSHKSSSASHSKGRCAIFNSDAVVARFYCYRITQYISPLVSSPHVDFLLFAFTRLAPALRLSLVSNLAPKMWAVYLRGAKAIPLGSPTRCFIPKRDLFSKINRAHKGLPQWYLPWHEGNSPSRNHCFFNKLQKVF